MALTSTMYTFDVALNDVDRGVYESLAIKAACHPSETEEYFATRILAYCLEYREGIAFSKGLSEPDVPAISVRDLTGALRSWIEVGSPDAARLHKASKASPRVAVYTHKEPRIFLRAYEGERIHKAESIEMYAMDFEWLSSLAQSLQRRTTFTLTVSEQHIYLS